MRWNETHENYQAAWDTGWTDTGGGGRENRMVVLESGRNGVKLPSSLKLIIILRRGR